jgi:hypothetical protein
MSNVSKAISRVILKPPSAFLEYFARAASQVASNLVNPDSEDTSCNLLCLQRQIKTMGESYVLDSLDVCHLEAGTWLLIGIIFPLHARAHAGATKNVCSLSKHRFSMTT